MGLKVVSDDKGTKIYRKDRQTKDGNTFATYSIMVSSKAQDGSWKNGYIDCAFRKGEELANKSKIKINDSFFTVNEYQGKSYVKLFISDYELLEGGEAPNDDFLTMPDDLSDVPFN